MSNDTKQCPYCAETIKSEAVVCRFCGRELNAGDSTKPSPTTEKKKSSRGTLLLAIVGIIVACLIITSLPSRNRSASTSNTSSSSSSSSVSSSRATSTPAPQLKPITLTGRGDDIVSVDKADVPAIARISTTQSNGNFAVTSYDSNGNRINLLVNEIGSYSGTRPIDFLNAEHTSRFEVVADGSWKIEILPLTSARSLSIPGKMSGTGDDVITLRGSTPDVATISHTGDSNFAITSYGASGRDLLVNEIGSYNGTVIVNGDTIILEIVADGSWSIDISSR